MTRSRVLFTLLVLVLAVGGAVAASHPLGAEEVALLALIPGVLVVALALNWVWTGRRGP